MQTSPSPKTSRDRRATSPLSVTRHGWWSILWRVYGSIQKHHIGMMASSIAFYGLLSLFPAIAALISIWGMYADPVQVQQQLVNLDQFIPTEAASIIEHQAEVVTASAGRGLNLTAIGSLLFTLYSASKSVQSFTEGLNIIYGEKEQRHFLAQIVINIVLTLGMILLAIFMLFSVAILPVVMNFFPFADTLTTSLYYLRWLIMLCIITLGIAVLYRFGPNRRAPRWEWLSIGTITSTLLWILGSLGFSLYVSHFGSYNSTYGSIGAVVVLLMWFWLSAYIILLGASINCELERTTEKDTTTGAPKPMGQRHAYAADTVAKDSNDI
ncbi:YihY/virulence factor BrkB family protein [Zymobacter sp. IVIA_12111.31 C1]|uniref:YihY/virulence factor BrkB family protein n=1 Tax=Zymobacter sp. IVIA_12111.31 C1 TaxID=3394854 RepID=UPI0039C001FB